jgi:hypothetical protein
MVKRAGLSVWPYKQQLLHCEKRICLVSYRRKETDKLSIHFSRLYAHTCLQLFCLLFPLPQSHLAMVSARADFDSSKTDTKASKNTKKSKMMKVIDRLILSSQSLSHNTYTKLSQAN